MNNLIEQIVTQHCASQGITGSLDGYAVLMHRLGGETYVNWSRQELNKTHPELLGMFNQVLKTTAEGFQGAPMEPAQGRMTIETFIGKPYRDAFKDLEFFLRMVHLQDRHPETANLKVRLFFIDKELRLNLRRYKTSALTKTALYWADRDRKYRATTGEREDARYICPRCPGEILATTTYKRESGKSTRLLGCHKCLFLIRKQDVVGHHEIEAEEG